MLAILSKPREDITPDDVQALVDASAQENETLEFKQELPASKRKSNVQAGSNGDIGDRAKRALLKESVAFANAYGGTLLLGISEQPRHVASTISPVPHCKDLADRLHLVFRDCIDPQLPHVEIFGVETEGDAGVVIVRVPKSRLAPHRDTKTHQCWVRRSNRSEPMSMREVQDTALNVSRGLQWLDDELSRRSRLFRRQFRRLRTPKDAYGLRFTAIPVANDIRIDRLLHGDSLDPRFRPPLINVVRYLPEQGRSSPLHGVREVYNFNHSNWEPRLRAVRSERIRRSWFSRDTISFISYQELHFHGLIELGLLSVSNERNPANQAVAATHWLHRELPVVEFALLAKWAQQVRAEAGAPTAEYALHVQIDAKGPCHVIHHNVVPQASFGSLGAGSTTFPLYPLGEPEHLPKLLDIFERDFVNACGKDVADQQGNLTTEERDGQ